MNVLIKDYRQPKRRLSYLQKKTVKEINTKLSSESLEVTLNHCLCGNKHEDKDVIITQRDMWGINIGQVLCSQCGLIRNRYVFSKSSNNLFYEKYYRKLYNNGSNTDYRYFNMQCQRGAKYLSLLTKYGIIDEIEDIAEFGCGAGGVLKPFSDFGKKVVGVDLDSDFFNIGKGYGLHLESGDFHDIVKDNNCDLVIMSHVLEHLCDPVGELIKVLKKIKKDKFLLIQVPGLYKKAGLHYPVSSFQVAHVFYFYEDWLSALFTKLGLEIIHSDDICTFILRKKSDDNKMDILYDGRFVDKFKQNLSLCIKCQLSLKSVLVTERIRDFLFIIRGIARKILNLL